MGIYLNPGSMRYQMAIRSDIYVDKTEMIAYVNSVLNTNQRYLSVSRPRRFGKTMAADMLCTYYGKNADSRSLFEDRKIAQQQEWDKYLNRFDVIRLNMIDFLTDSENITEMITYLSDEVMDELQDAYPDVSYGRHKNVKTAMNKVYSQLDHQFVVIIDEWDAVFREYPDRKKEHEQYLDFLRDWLKDKDYIAFAYMTGILPIKKYGKHSALNMFDEYSMLAPMQLAPYTGFLEEEIKELCEAFGMKYDDIQSWYNGYTVSDWIPFDKRRLYQEGKYQAHQYALYSPLSVVKAVRNGRLQNYWNETETYAALSRYIDRNYEGLKDDISFLMKGGRKVIDVSGYQNDMTTFHNKDDIMTLLIHLGYLSYDSETKEVFIPNREILDVFKTSTKSEEWTESFRSLERSQRLLDATLSCDEERVAELVEAAHNRAGNKTYNSEAVLSYAIQRAYHVAENYYTVIQELDTGKGYADLVYLPSPNHADKPALLVELKYKRDADTAIDQIHRQKYPDALEHYKGNIILVAINYNREVDSQSEYFKHHSCVIEKV